MSSGYEIPITADLSGMQEAIARIGQHIHQMGSQISASLGGANNHLGNTENAMRRVTGTATTVTNAHKTLGESVSQSRTKMNGAIATAANMGTAMGGLESAVNLASRATKLLSGTNLGATLTGWIARAGGIRAAFARIPATMRAIAANPLFRRIAIGAAAAAAAIIAIRTATRIISSTLRTMGRLANGIFNGMRATATATARAIGGTFRNIASLPKKLFTTLPGVGGLLAGAGGLALLTHQLKGASEKAAVFEDLTVSVEHFTGSVHAAKNLLADLAEFAIKTPFETIEVQQTASGLLGAGIREDVAGITKDLAAMSKNGQQLRELGDAVGKGFAKGKFQTQELNKFLERGINLHPALQAQIGLTGDAYTKAVQAGLSFQTVTAALRSMSTEGGQFFGLLDRRAQTFTGLLSTLSAAWTDVRQAFGKPFNDSLKPIIQSAINSVTTLLERARTLGERVGRAITLAFVAFQQGKLGDVFRKGLTLGVSVAIDILMRGLRGAVAFLATALPPIFSAAGSKLSDPMFWSGIKNIFVGLGQTITAAIQEALPGQDKQLIAGRKALADSSFNLGSKQINLAGGVDLGKTIGTAISSGNKAFLDAAGGEMSANVKAAQENLSKTLETLKAAADAIQKKTAEGTALQGTTIAAAAGAQNLDTLEETIGTAVREKVGTLTTSLQRVGGGGIGLSFGGVIGKISQSNTLLQVIAMNTQKTNASTLTVLA